MKEIEMINIHIDSSKRGDTRTTIVTLTGTDIDLIHLIDQLDHEIGPGPAQTLKEALMDGTPLVARNWPPDQLDSGPVS